MSWLFPAFLAGAFAVALPILLHMLRRRPRRTVVFPSLRFIAATLQKTEKHHRIQRWIVLALRCAALLLLAAAFARPFFGRNTGQTTRAVIVVIDNSFSLQTRDRWPALRAWAVDQIGLLNTGDKLGLLLMGPRPTWLVAPSTDTAGALAALQRYTPGWEATRAELALRLAADTLAALPTGERRLVYLGDHQRVSWAGVDFDKKLPPGVTAVFPELPKRVTQQAALLTPTLVPGEKSVRATVTVKNFTGPQSRRLRVYRGSELTPVQEESLALGEHETLTRKIDLPANTEGFTSFRFTLDADELPADDTAYAVWQSTAEHSVMLDPAFTGSGADFVASALASTATLKPAVRIVPAGSWPPNAVAVLRGAPSFTGPAAARLDGFLQGGGSALVFVDGNPAQKNWFASHGIVLRAAKAEADSLRVHDWSMDHPVVAALSEQRVAPLLGWNFRRGWALPTDAVEPLALWSENAVAIGEFKVGAGRVLVCGFSADRRDSEWPLHPVFVPFIHRAVVYLLGAQESGITRAARVGEVLALPAGPGNWRALDGPDAGRPAQAVAGAVVATAPGVYEFSSGPTRKLFAVNLAPEESDPASWTEGTPWTKLPSTVIAPTNVALPQMNLAAFEAEQRSPLWWGLIVAVALLLIAELGLANRTTR